MRSLKLIEDYVVELTTKEQLDDLPEFSIIVAEIEEYAGAHVLTKYSACCSGWHTFAIVDDGTIEPLDDFTPQLPAVLLVEGERWEWHE
jgi:hypothetical protein